MKLLKNFVEKGVNPVLRRLGGEIVPRHKAASLESALGRLAAKKIQLGTVIDVGASDGKWSKVTQKYFPIPKYLLIEAQAEAHSEGLQAFKRASRNNDFVLAAAGDRIGDVFFDASDPLGGVASHSPLEGNRKNVIRVPVTTIDVEIEKRGLQGPYLIKLDTHGFEMPILEGAKQALADTAIIIIEAYNFEVAENSLRFHEMISFLEQRGFRVADLFDPVFRNRDGVLWQLDLALIRSDRPEFDSNSF